MASEVMAVLALASDLHDLRARLGRMVLATTRDGTPITAEDLKVAGAMAVLLKDAIKPNLLQTLEGGPGLRALRAVREHRPRQQRVLADRVALATTDIVVHGGGFGADMGAEKFFDIKCRASGLRPDAAVDRRHDPRAQDARRGRPDRGGQAARPGAARRRTSTPCGAAARTSPSRSRTSPRTASVVVAINTFPTDTPAEIEAVREVALAAGARDAVVARHFTDGGAGAEELAEAVWAAAEDGAPDFRLLYPDEAPLAREDRGDRDPDLRRRRGRLPPAGEGSSRSTRPRASARLPICMAKTQYSSATTRSSSGRPPGSASRSGRSGFPPAPASSRRSRARCGRCPGCTSARAASASTSTPTGTSSGCSDGLRRRPRRASGGEREARGHDEPRGHDHPDDEPGHADAPHPPVHRAERGRGMPVVIVTVVAAVVVGRAVGALDDG